MGRQHTTLKIRLSDELRAQLTAAADRRGESASLVVREALAQYIQRQAAQTGVLYPPSEDVLSHVAEAPAPTRKHPRVKKAS